MINNESASKVFTTSTLASLFDDQAEGTFATKTAILGHLQQGGSPQGIDRVYAVTFASTALKMIEHQFESKKTESGCVGFLKGGYAFTPIAEMVKEMDFKNRRTYRQWWMDFKDIFAKVSSKP